MSINSQKKNLQQESILKAQRMILDFNKNGLNYLASQKTYSQSYDYFKKAQKFIIDQLKINPDHKKINQLAAITYNNLACYYKKLNKPNVALSYLKKGLQIQVYKVENWLSTASTHLNICAIYSFMNKHQQAKQHAILSGKILQKLNLQGLKQKPQDQKVYFNIKMLSNYNTAIQLQHLKKYEQSLKSYQQTKQIALKFQQKNQLLIKQCNESIQRMKQQIKLTKQRLLEIITKRKQGQQKGNYQFMRKNKKNYQSNNQKDNIKTQIQNKKYSQYKVDQNQPNISHHNSLKKKKYQSQGKLISIRPILHTESQKLEKLSKSNVKYSQKGLKEEKYVKENNKQTNRDKKQNKEIKQNDKSKNNK